MFDNALTNIPQELRAYPQWVVSNDLVHKIPLDPKTGKLASVSNPATWGTYEQAIACRCAMIGFVLTHQDPYCIIDLDDKIDNPATDEDKARFRAIMQTFNTYTEISHSGRGVHLVCKGQVPRGLNKDHVEIYSSGRYMVFTGKVINNVPIGERQHLITPMFEQMATDRDKANLLWLDAECSDAYILHMGMNAINGSGEKFRNLWNMPLHPNQNEADFALLSLLAFYSKSDEQVIRLFRQSSLGQRKKAWRDDYMVMSLEKIRASFKKPEIDFSQLRFSSEAAVESSLEWPPGLIGECARYIYDTSKRPVKEISIAAAFALVTGIAARSYNIEGTGLNQYIILVAGTGRGKEDARKGIKRLWAACRNRTKLLGEGSSFVDDFKGPGLFASGKGVHTALLEKPCMLSIVGEFGKRLQEMTGKSAPPHLEDLKTILLDIYNQSGKTDSLDGSAYSKKENNHGSVKSPNLTIFGEGATETFYENLDARHILEGLVPRFWVIEYKGPRVRAKKIIPAEPPEELVRKLVLLFQTAYMAGKNEATCDIAYEPLAERMLDAFDESVDDLINNASDAIVAELWNRCALKAYKIAAAIAVGKNPYAPKIAVEDAKYAIDAVKESTLKMIGKFSAGEVGEGDHRQEHDFMKACEKYWSMKPKERRDGYNIAERLAEYNTVVPYTFLKKHLRLRSSFKNDRRGAYGAIDNLIARLIRDGTLAEVPAEQAATVFESKSVLYTKGREWH